MAIAAADARLMVGLEIHIELATRSKMFTSAPNVAHPDYDGAAPNSLTDPVVLGMPGVLPVINKQAVEMAMKVGLALGCTIAKRTKWDRKSYYYPDLPKNYQISQYDQPLCHDGAVELPGDDGTTKTIRILRAHLEEDAGKLLHEAPGGGAIDGSIVDLNRAGTPLLEIVTHPDFDSADQVVRFCQMLRDICRHLGVTEGVMQKGHMRFEPNINVILERGGKTYKTPIVEIKNLNSFKAVEGAIHHEYRRQIDEWESTGVVMTPGTKSTRGWDDGSQTTFLQREKEEAHDYRYFPDPDLVAVEVDEAWLARVKATLPETPAQKLTRFTTELKIDAKAASQLLDDPRVCGFFEAILKEGVEPRRAAAVVLNNLAKRANEKGVPASALGVSPGQVKAIEGMIAAGQVSSGAADELYGLCIEHSGGDPAKLAAERGLLQVNDDSALDGWVDAAIAANPKAAADFKAGKEAALTSLMGGVMKQSKGKANPAVVREKLKAKLTG